MKKLFLIRLVCATLLASLFQGCAVKPVQQADTKSPIEIPAGETAKPLAFRKIMTKLPLGEQIGTIQYGWGCFPGTALTWRGGRLNITDEELTETFRKELESRNYPIVGDPYALFGDPSDATAEVFVAGLVTKVDLKVCFPFSGSPTLDVGNTSTVKGGAFMGVTWQIYSRKARKVVLEISTQGSYQTDTAVAGGFPVILRDTFAANVRNLLADQRFHKLLTEKEGEGSEPPPSNGI